MLLLLAFEDAAGQDACPHGRVIYCASLQDQFKIRQSCRETRAQFKQDRRILVLLGSLSLTLPAEFFQDVLILDGPLPNLAQLEGIILQQFANVGADKPDRKTVDQAVDAVCGFWDTQSRGALIHCLSILPFVDRPEDGIAKIREMLASVRFSMYELGPLVTALGESRSPEALRLLLAEDPVAIDQRGLNGRKLSRGSWTL